MRCLLLVLLICLFAGSAMAGAPIVGNYSPSDGRFSESWVGGQEGAVGNTVNALSWVGGNLGLEWKLQCNSIQIEPTIIEDTIDEYGTGYIKYKTVYGGGTMWLSSTGSWGDEDYTADVNETGMVVTSTHQFVMGTRTGVVSDITVRGVFVNYSNCFAYTLSNAVIWGAGTEPAADYPEFLDANCDSGTMGFGAWGDVDDIFLAIYAPTDPECTIPVQEATWGHVKSLYRD